MLSSIARQVFTMLAASPVLSSRPRSTGLPGARLGVRSDATVTDGSLHSIEDAAGTWLTRLGSRRHSCIAVGQSLRGLGAGASGGASLLRSHRARGGAWLEAASRSWLQLHVRRFPRRNRMPGDRSITLLRARARGSARSRPAQACANISRPPQSSTAYSAGTVRQSRMPCSPSWRGGCASVPRGPTR